MPSMGSTMAGGGGAASGFEGAMNSVPPPSPSAGGGSGDAVAVDPPPISVASNGESSGSGSSTASGSAPASGQDVPGDGGQDAASVRSQSVPDSGPAEELVTVQPQGKTRHVSGPSEANISASVPEGAGGGGVTAVEVGSATSIAGGAPSAAVESPVGEANVAGEQPTSSRSRSDGRTLGERISGVHNAAAQAHQHLPQDSATVSAPTLNIQHGE